MAEQFKQDEEETVVMFRVDIQPGFGSPVFALFPETPIDYESYHCPCYLHVGKFTKAEWLGCIAHSRAARPEEYAGMKEELESPPYGYRLKVADWHTEEMHQNLKIEIRRQRLFGR